MTLRISLLTLLGLLGCAPASLPCPKAEPPAARVVERTVVVAEALPCEGLEQPCVVMLRTDRLSARGGPEVALLDQELGGVHRYSIASSFTPGRWRSVPLFTIANNEGTGGFDEHELLLRKLEVGPARGMFSVVLDVEHRSYRKGGIGAIDDPLHLDTISHGGQTITVWVDVESGAPRIVLALPTMLRQDEPARTVAQLAIVDTAHGVQVGPAQGAWPRELADVLGTHDVKRHPLVRAYAPVELPDQSEN